uniref:Chromosome 3 open reading frame 70 n=1 Tax=Hucho hucho TaxID=62062 RepID=A0A4W5MV05_9TELE
MTNVCRLPSTPVPATPTDHPHTMDLTVSLAERFLMTASTFQAPPCLESPKFCIISDLFMDDYMVKRINGKMCYVQRPQPSTMPSPPQSHPPHPRKPQPHPQRTPRHHPHPQPRPHPQGTKPCALGDKVTTPKIDPCSSPSSSEDSGINALGGHYMESCDEVSEEDEEEEDDEEPHPQNNTDNMDDLEQDVSAQVDGGVTMYRQTQCLAKAF